MGCGQRRRCLLLGEHGRHLGLGTHHAGLCGGLLCPVKRKNCLLDGLVCRLDRVQLPRSDVEVDAPLREHARVAGVDLGNRAGCVGEADIPLASDVGNEPEVADCLLRVVCCCCEDLQRLRGLGRVEPEPSHAAVGSLQCGFEFLEAPA